MNEAEQALFNRISRFSFDEGGEELTVARRLARENGWTQAFTERVHEEYKRFVFLAMVAGHPVTPSDQIDQAASLKLQTLAFNVWPSIFSLPISLPH